MQVSIEVQKELYEEVLSSGVDMQSKFNEYLRSQLDENSYMESVQFEEDKADLHEALQEWKSGKVKALSHEEFWSNIENHLQEK